MNILFLDDSHSRHDFVCKKKHDVHAISICNHGRYVIYHAYTVNGLMNFFEIGKDYFDFVYLDHDLSQEDPNNLGTVAAKYLVDNFDNYEDRIGKIIIHSWNVPGAKNMEAILRDGGYTDILISPFSCA